MLKKLLAVCRSICIVYIMYKIMYAFLYIYDFNTSFTYKKNYIIIFSYC